MQIFRSRSSDRRLDPDYVSEFTRFMDEFMASHPEQQREQRKGWRIYWDQNVDLHALEEEREDSVPTPAYYYFDLPHKPHH